MGTFHVSFLFLQCYFMINAEELSTVVDLSNELKSEKSGKSDSTTKSILRYGFQKTEACKDFERAFLCIRKCLDLNYDVAYSDKHCKCTCYTKRDKAKYTPAGRPNQTRYKLGAPTTSKPIWAQDSTEPEPETKSVGEDHKVLVLEVHPENDTQHVEGESTTADDEGGELDLHAEGVEEDAHTEGAEGEEGEHTEGEGVEGAHEEGGGEGEGATEAPAEEEEGGNEGEEE